MEKIIYFGIIIICSIAFIVIFSKLLKEFGKQLKLAQVTSVKVSCAGSSIANAPREVRVQLYNRKFYDRNNHLLNPDAFGKFWVKGWSMLLCGIEDNDLLFTREVHFHDNISFDRPHVYVLKRDDYVRNKVATKNDLAEFKVRRAWAIVHIGKDDLMIECAKKIITSAFFADLRKKHPDYFLSDKEMLDDFKNERIEKYKNQYPNSTDASDDNNIAIISTTLKASKGNKVTFSIHPARIIVGEVVYSYKM